MAWIEKIEGKNGDTYRLAWRDRSGKRFSRTFKRKRDAEHLRDKVRLELHEGDALDPNRAKVSFGKTFQHFLDTSVLERATVELYEGTFRRYLKDRLGPVPLRDISKARLRTL